MTYRIDTLGQLLQDASRAIRRRFEQRTACHGLSATQWRLLRHLQHAGPSTQAVLADALDVEPISVSRLVDRMEQSGWVARIPHPEDRRARLIQPTDKASAVADSVRAIAQDVYDEALAGLDDAARREFELALRAVTQSLCRVETPESGLEPSDERHE